MCQQVDGNDCNATWYTHPAYKEVDYTKQSLTVLKVLHQTGALRYGTLKNFIALVELGAEELKKL